jgi:outer membrane murein-binding lipoprotein Lpp
MRIQISMGAAGISLAACLVGAPARADDAASRDAELRARLEELVRQNRTMQEEIRQLRRDVDRARDEARAARDEAREAPEPSPPGVAGTAVQPSPSEGGAILSHRVGRANLQLLDIALDTLFSFGWSDASDADLETLQGGEHDPRQRGFNLQQVELSFLGAVDPYMTGEAHLVFFLDSEGESRFELEEAFLTSQLLPFGLTERGVQIEAGHVLTEFGRINPTHPHAWDWQDQPVILTRLFGGDGMRAPGIRAAWLTPLPWFSELQLGAQNAKGETMVSFLANDEVFEERPVGGRPFADPGVHGLSDLVYLARWVNGIDLSETTTAQLGLSGLFGPNATGSSARTRIAGADLVLKWRPLASERGWPFVTWQSEFAFRDYEADAFFGCPEEPDDDGGCPVAPVTLGSETLRDWGFYSQLLWGFRRGWSTGLRLEYATGSGDDVTFDEVDGAFTSLSRNDDPFRDDRLRVSPLLAFHPSEFSRLRLQYNWDRAKHLDERNAHSVWAGVEFLFGAHPAHAF